MKFLLSFALAAALAMDPKLIQEVVAIQTTIAHTLPPAMIDMLAHLCHEAPVFCCYLHILDGVRGGLQLPLK